MHVCECGAYYRDAKTSALEHIFNSDVCSVCNASNHEHTYNVTVVSPTCTTYGYTEHTCTSCGNTYQDTETLPTGHDYDSTGKCSCGKNQIAEEITSVEEVYTYIYNGDKLTQMNVGNQVLYFTYDAAGQPVTVDYNGTVYYYVTNIQGDVVGLLDEDGVQVVSYVYDAWGNSLGITGDLAVTLGQKNPLRYRSYVYDSETSLYYLQSRYYDPEIGRFINADALTSTGQGLLGNNMFTYCMNKPVSLKDPSGEYAILIEIGILLAAAVGVALSAYPAVKETSNLLSNITISLPKNKNTSETILRSVASKVVEVYAYRKAIAEKLTKASENIPHVHHIVPAGKFSNRSQKTVNQINQMHEKLETAGINRYFDPMNLMLVSAKTHARLHTDSYIDHVHNYIMSSGNSKTEIYNTLFYLRLEIAAWDMYARGYQGGI